MSNNPPVCTQKAPYAVELEAGDHYWCACGRSKNQPFCDGAHAGSGIGPTKLTVTRSGTHYLCGCRASKNGAFCDGSHSSL
jgi:CDGSH-type Zn-finger protein